MSFRGSSFDSPRGSSFSSASAKALEEPSQQDRAGVDSKRQEIATTATTGKAVTRPLFDFDFAGPKISRSSMFKEFDSSSSSLSTQSSFSSSAKRTASTPGVGFSFSSSGKIPEKPKSPEQD
jgi:hypothetical protein